MGEKVANKIQDSDANAFDSGMREKKIDLSHTECFEVNEHLLILSLPSSTHLSNHA